MRPRILSIPAFAVLFSACSENPQGPGSILSSPHPDSVPAEITSWLQANAQPFSTIRAGSGFTDLEFLREMIGTARVVALGEATHGTGDFFLMKHRMLEFLVKEMDFNVFAIEASWPEGNRVNDFLHSGVGDPLVLLSGLYFWTCATEEVLDMILWMREHNQDPGDDPTVSFFGFDMQYPGMAIHNVLSYLEEVDPQSTTWASTAYGCMLPFANGPGGRFPGGEVLYGIQTLEYRNACLSDLREIHEFLLTHRGEYSSVSSDSAFARAARSARIVVQFEEKESFRRPGVRDLFMAENVEWLLEQAGPDAKIVLWAHNGHVADDPYFDGGGSMGHHLREEYRDDMVIAAFDFHLGEFQAVTVSDAGTLMGLNIHSVEFPPRYSYEHYFHSAGMERFILDMRGVPPGAPATSWLAGPRPMRFIGAGFNPSFSDQYVKELSLPSQFDLVVYFDTTEAAIGLNRRFPGSW